MYLLFSQLPSAQNNQNAKTAYLGVACFGPLQWALETPCWIFHFLSKKQTWQEFEWLSKCPLGCPLGMAVISFTSCFICCILVGEMAWDLRHELKCVADAGICYTWPNPPHIFPCHQSLICSIVLLRCVQIYHFSEIA